MNGVMSVSSVFGRITYRLLYEASRMALSTTTSSSSALSPELQSALPQIQNDCEVYLVPTMIEDADHIMNSQRGHAGGDPKIFFGNVEDANGTAWMFISSISREFFWILYTSFLASVLRGSSMIVGLVSKEAVKAAERIVDFFSRVGGVMLLPEIGSPEELYELAGISNCGRHWSELVRLAGLYYLHRKLSLYQGKLTRRIALVCIQTEFCRCWAEGSLRKRYFYWRVG